MAKTLTIGPAALNIVMRKGATFNKVFTYKLQNPDTGVRTPVDLTDWSARMQIRLTTDTPDPPILDLESPAGIVLGDEDGTIQPIITDDVSAAWDFESAVYDLELISPAGDVIPLFGGTFKTTEETAK